MDLFAFIFHPPGYSVAAKARKLVHEKKNTYLKKFGFNIKNHVQPDYYLT